VDYEMVRDSAQLIVDTRNAIAGIHSHVFKIGAPAPAATVEPRATSEQRVA